MKARFKDFKIELFPENETERYALKAMKENNQNVKHISICWNHIYTEEQFKDLGIK